MGKAQKVIDFGAISDVARRGVRRATVFMGLGLNAANDPSFKDYQLSKLKDFEGRIRTDFMPPDLDDKTITEFKEEFSAWIVANGLREVIEAYAVFLDRIHNACLMMAWNQGKLKNSHPESWAKAFPYKGIEDKLKLLEKRFAVRPEHSNYIVSINFARRCLTHRLGRVCPEDCQPNESSLKVTWRDLEIFAELASGEIVSLNEIPEEGRELPGGAQVKLRFVEKSRSFPQGSIVRLHVSELTGICHFMLFSIGEVVRSAIQYGEGIGIRYESTAPKPSK